MNCPQYAVSSLRRLSINSPSALVNDFMTFHIRFHISLLYFANLTIMIDNQACLLFLMFYLKIPED